MTNDARVQNTVLRNGSLWATHTVMVAATPSAAGVGYSTANPDIRSDVQWWQIDPTIETGTAIVPLQRARIEDPLADNCHNGAGGTRTVGTCTSTAAQVGLFYAFPNISVNVNNDVLIGFAIFSPYTYPNGAYAIRRSTDPLNTLRDYVTYRPGQANYNIGGGSGTSRQNRWGDYSAAQTDPLDDTKFWTIQEYAGTVRDFGIGLAGNWETWWAQVDPAAAAPVANQNLVISEFRLRGPQGTRDEFVELYNPSDTPMIVQTTDNSDGWALAMNNGTTSTALAVVPYGAVIPARGHFLIADNPDAANGPTLVYSLNNYAAKTDPASLVRGADSDTGYSVDIPDTNGIALFKSAVVANFTSGNAVDAAGPATLPPTSIFKEGTGYGALPSANIQYTMFRDLATMGTSQDTNNNATDFRFVDTAATLTGAGQRLGAPGPENLDGPVRLTTPVNLTSAPLDSGVGPDAAPNRQRDLADTGTNKTFGTISFRRTFTNNSGAPLTTLRFRIVDLTTTPATGMAADLRLLSATDEAAVGTTGGPVAVKGTTLQQPPAQALGGGYNSSANAGVITLAAPLANGASVSVRFLLGVEKIGTYRFCITAETLPATARMSSVITAKPKCPRIAPSATSATRP